MAPKRQLLLAQIRPVCWIAIASLAISPGANAQSSPPLSAPGVFYAWQTTDISLERCLERSTEALLAANLSQLQRDDNSVAGRANETTALMVCLPAAADSTTVMIVVSSWSDEGAIALREALQSSF